MNTEYIDMKLKRIKNKECPKCGVPLQLVEGELFTYFYPCRCFSSYVGYANTTNGVDNNG